MSIRKPWFRTEKSCWYVWHAGAQVRLHPEEGEAYRLWHELALGLRVAGGPTVRQVAESYTPTLAGAVCDKVRSTRTRVLAGLAAALGQTPAASFTHVEALVWISSFPRWGQSYRWTVGKILKTAFKWAAESGLIEENPLALLRLPGCKSRGAEALVSEDTHRMLLAVAPHGIREVLVALRHTGCRPSEVTNLRSLDYDRPSGTWTIFDHKTAGKTFAVRTVYLTPLMVGLSERLAAARPAGRMFVNGRGDGCAARCVERWMRRACGRLGVKATAYGYRHTLATDLLAAGVPDAHVAELLGHRGTRMLHRHYSHLGGRRELMKDAVGKVRG